MNKTFQQYITDKKIVKTHRVGKWSNYPEVYDRHLQKFKGTHPKILEIGNLGGGGLAMLNYVFEECEIYGLDIDDLRSYENDFNNLKMFVGSQADQKILQKIIEETPKLDVILDDGSHACHDQIKTFLKLFPHVADNGVYICEDIHTSYWPNQPSGTFSQPSFIDFTKMLIDLMHLDSFFSPKTSTDHWVSDASPWDASIIKENFNKEEIVYLLDYLYNISIHNGIIVFEKKLSTPAYANAYGPGDNHVVSEVLDFRKDRDKLINLITNE
tara:strand:- start:211 stop:1020 length:810 start_codon:yes stop_codon:yes gene_type:complete